MKQEPVAWMRRQDGRIIRLTPERIRETDEPLYTSPQYRELSDDEILEELFIPKYEWESYKAQVCLKQIRAILRKAQENE